MNFLLDLRASDEVGNCPCHCGGNGVGPGQEQVQKNEVQGFQGIVVCVCATVDEVGVQEITGFGFAYAFIVMIKMMKYKQ